MQTTIAHLNSLLVCPACRRRSARSGTQIVIGRERREHRDELGGRCSGNAAQHATTKLRSVALSIEAGGARGEQQSAGCAR